MSDLGMRPWALGAALLAAVALPSAVNAQQNDDVLTLGDDQAARRLIDMAERGDLSFPGHAGAWVVISSVALGIGRDHCGLPLPGDTSFIATPALDGMTIEQIVTLNRLVTANYRAAETKSRIDLSRLHPITRQAVRFLGYGEDGFDCARVAEIWANALSYESNRAR